MTVEDAEQFVRLGLTPPQNTIYLEIFEQYVDYYGLNSTIEHYEKLHYKFDNKVIEYIKQARGEQNDIKD